MLYIGIDPSLTGTGLVSYQTAYEIPIVKTFTVGNKNATKSMDARLRRYDKLLGEILVWLPAGSSGIAIEGYSFGSKGNTLTGLAEFGGILRFHLIVDQGLRVVEVPPATLKLFACGKGTADKGTVKLAVWKRWKVEFDNDNETDAYVLARIAACHFGDEKPDNDAQRRALAKLV